jgi:hypothetical protein
MPFVYSCGFSKATVSATSVNPASVAVLYVRYMSYYPGTSGERDSSREVCALEFRQFLNNGVHILTMLAFAASGKGKLR